MSYQQKTITTYIYIGCVILVLLFLYWQKYIYVNLGSGIQEHIEKQGERGTGLQDISAQLRVSPFGTQEKFLNLLNDMKYSLHGARYVISNDTIKDVLRKKSKQGVDIRIMLENKLFGDDQGAYKKFQQSLAGTQIKLKNDAALGINYLHVKAAVIDKTKAYISTSNLTYSSFHKNREYMITTEHTGVVQSLDRILEKDRQGSHIGASDIHPNLLVCPIDCRKKILSSISTAQQSITIQTQYIQDKEIIQELLLAKKRGVSIKILVSDGQDPDWIDVFGKDARIQVTPYLHTKSMMIDNQRLMIASINFSTNSLDNNREIGIYIHNQKSRDIRTNQFTKDRLNAKEYSVKILKK